jgi:hypothetical protein
MRRVLQRQWRLPLAGIALLLVLGQQPGLAAMIPVGDACTLVDAITAANMDTATGGCPAGSDADTIVLPVGSTQTLTSVNNDTYGPTGLPVMSSVITIEGQGSTITRDSGVPDFRILALNSTGDLTLQETTVSGGVTPPFGSGGGVANYGGTLTVTNSTIAGNASDAGGGVENFGGTLTVTNSTIAGNASAFGGGVENFGGTLTITNSTIAGNASNFGGGVENCGGTLTVTNSTISGNASDAGGGVENFGGTLTITNSTISGNASAFGGGVENFGGTLTLVRTLVAGNTAPTGPEIANNGTVLADNHNLFGVDGAAGVEGFSPGATDVVPPVGVLLTDILNPTLAFNGGFTQTHALVPGSPAVDAGGPDCLDANGDPLPTDQRGKLRIVDGDGDGTAACDIGAFEFFPLVNDFVTLAPDLDTTFDPTPGPEAPAGTFTITATFTNSSATALHVPFFLVTELSGGNLVLNAEEGAQGVGATVPLEAGDRVLDPGETAVVDFLIGLQEREPFRFFVDLFGEPLP